MRTVPVDLDGLPRPGESFTARTLRLKVRGTLIAKESSPAPAPVAVEPPPEPEPVPESQAMPAMPGMLLVRLQAARAMATTDLDEDMPAAGSLRAAQRFGIAGTIDAIAGNGSGFDIGHAVYGVTCTQPSTGTDGLVVIEACRMARMPSRLTFEEAAGVAVDGTSAWQMLFRIGRVEAGESVMILGAATPIGALALQLAAVHGVHTVALSESPAHDDALLRLGADKVVDGRPGSLEAHCRTAALVIDTIGGESYHRAAASVQPGCTIVSCIERPDVFTAARRRTRSLFCVPESTTQCLARLAMLVDEAHVSTSALAGRLDHD